MSVTEASKELFVPSFETKLRAKKLSNGTLVVPLDNPSLEDLKDARRILVERMGTDYRHQRIVVNFGVPTKVYIHRRKWAELTRMKVGMFESSETICYTFHKRTGYAFQHLAYHNITSFAIVGSELLGDPRAEKVKALLKRIHPNAWPEYQWRNAKKDPDKLDRLRYYGLSPVSISKVFEKEVIERIEEAFESRTEFSFSKSNWSWKTGHTHHWNVLGRVDEDGSFRAWFTSRDWNGRSWQYMLLNPRTAAFCERD